MKKKPAWKTSAITDAQAQAIGYLTINFNFLEHAVAAFIHLIVAPDSYGLDKPLISPLAFTRKLDVLKTMAESLSQHYVPTEENDAAYASFLSATKDLISKARVLNRFRNDILHWRYDADEQKIKVEASAQEIDARSGDCHDVAISMFAHAMGLRKGDDTLSFGQQFAKK